MGSGVRRGPGSPPDTKELRYLAELVANAGVEQHPLDLVDRVEGVAPASTGLAAPVDRRAPLTGGGPHRDLAVKSTRAAGSGGP